MHRHPRKCTDMQIWQENAFHGRPHVEDVARLSQLYLLFTPDIVLSMEKIREKPQRISYIVCDDH